MSADPVSYDPYEVFDYDSPNFDADDGINGRVEFLNDNSSEVGKDEWAYNAKLEGFDFNPKATARKANIKWMYKALKHSHERLPNKVLPVNLEHHIKAQDIICFDFVPALLSLLQDESLMMTKNLVINKGYPMSMYIPSDSKVGEANSGSHYGEELYQELAQGKNQLHVPIIIYLNGTVIDSKEHINICLVSFTTSFH